MVSIIAAFQFLTIFPTLIKRMFTSQEMGRAVAWFPLVGVVLGLALYAVNVLARIVFPTSVSAALTLFAWIIFTRGFHLDGFMDTCDGLFGGWTPERRLEIMKDSRLGSFGVAGGILVLLTEYAALQSSADLFPALMLSTTLGRWASPLVQWGGDHAVVRTPDGPGTLSGVEAPLKASAASIVAQAKRFVGLRYLWGGLSGWGFDCSGLVWDVFRVHGLTIPRDADPQFHHGTPVERSQLRPGDLLFWGSRNYADHVAIYAGNGSMVEAPDSAHSVRVVPVRWDRYYLGARRYLTR